MDEKIVYIEKLIKIEWQMFQQVNNMGGRADCQDDFETFYIMRRAQYEAWSLEMLVFFADYIEKCYGVGRNMVEEKYARMMRFTDSEYYETKLKNMLPPVKDECRKLIEEITPVMVQWEKEFSARFPYLASSGRPIESSEDVNGYTSMETYLIGELETYPVELLRMYKAYIEELLAQGKSYSMLNMGIMVRLYGYDSISEAEAVLKYESEGEE